MIKLYKVGTFICLLALLWGCNKGNEEVTVDLGYDYYPLSVGNAWVYEVKIIDKNTLSDDTVSYQLKEVVAEVVDGGDEDNYLLYRYKRTNETASWVIDSVWSVKKEKQYLVKTENNVRLQKLAFGVSPGLLWDGNRWNIFAEETYEIVSLGSSYTLKGVKYAAVLEVEQAVEKNLISSLDKRERYAKGVGLIEIYKEQLETQPGEKTLGFIYHQSLISYLLVD